MVERVEVELVMLHSVCTNDLNMSPLTLFPVQEKEVGGLIHGTNPCNPVYPTIGRDRAGHRNLSVVSFTLLV